MLLTSGERVGRKAGVGGHNFLDCDCEVVLPPVNREAEVSRSAKAEVL